MWIKKAEYEFLKREKEQIDLDIDFRVSELNKSCSQLQETVNRLSDEIAEWKQKYADEVQKRVELAERMNDKTEG